MPPGAGTGTSGGSAGDGDAIKVFLRVRPPMDGENEGQMCLSVDSTRNAIILQSKPEPKVFTFDQVADINTTQESVFCSVAKKLMDSCLDGYNGTIFAYGQTGSGKTFTMLGPAEGADVFQHELRGIIPRSFEYVFKLIQREQEMQGDKVQFLCKCSFLEIYNEQVFDLLDPASKGLHIRENMKRGVFVDGLIEEAVANACEAYQVLSAGWMNRTVASTSMNRESSRSHAVFTLHIESKINKGGVWNIKSSQLNLVDLAGSERQKDTNAVGTRLKEAGNINKSLSQLGNVIMALVDIAHGKSRHVPYRDSKLSFLLKDSLGGNAKTFIIACAHPGSRCFGESLSTLQFARRAKMIKNKAVVNEDSQGNLLLLQAEIKRLKEALSQCQQGVVQSNVPLAHGQTDTGANLSQEDIQWKKRFFKAMFFREKLLNEKKCLEEKYQGLEKVAQKQELSIQQSRMVLKFRNEALKKFDKARKSKVELDQEDKDVIIDNLRKEVLALQEMVEHNPVIAKYKMENNSLRAEIKRLTSDQSVDNINTEASAELDREYRELITQQEANGKDDVVAIITPKQSVEEKVAVATLERQKSQVDKLESELESVRHEMVEKEQHFKQTIMEQQAKVKSLQDGKERLERVLRAHYVKARIERETQEELTIETLKNMTTPKRNQQRALYNLRSRIVEENSSNDLQLTPPKMNLNDSLDEACGEELLTMSTPEEFKEVTIEALNELIKKLQERNRSKQSEFDTQDCEMVKLVEEKSNIESQLSQLRELYDNEKSVWIISEQDLRTTIKQDEEKVKDLIQSKALLKSEVEDFRIQSEYTYKQLQDIKLKEKEMREEKEHELGLLETKNMKQDVELAYLHKELSSAMEQKETLKDHSENLQATLDYTEEKSADLLKQLTQTKDDYMQLLKKHQSHLCQQEELQNSIQQLMLRQGDKEAQLMESLQDAQKLRTNLEQRQNMLEALEHTKIILGNEVEKLKLEKERLEKLCQDNKDAMNSLTQRLSEQRELLQQSERAREEGSAEVKELHLKLFHSEAECERLHQRISQAQVIAENETAELRTRLEQEAATAAVVQEDLESILQQLNTVTEERVIDQQKMDAIKKEKILLEEEACELKSQISHLDDNVCEYRNKLETMRRDQEERSLKQNDELQSNMLTLQRQLDERDEQLQSLHQAFNDVSSQLDSREATVNKLQEDFENATICKQEWEAKHNAQQDELNLKTNEWTERNKLLLDDAWVLTCRAEEADSAVMAALQDKQQALFDKNRLVEEKIGLKEELSSLTAEKEELIIDVERLKEALKCKDQNVVEVNSKCEELEEQFLQKEKKIKEQDMKLKEQEQELVHLAGHNNLKQKIHYVHTMKLENSQLKEQLKECSLEKGRLLKRIGDLEEVAVVLGRTPERSGRLAAQHTDLRNTPQRTPQKAVFSTPKGRDTPQKSSSASRVTQNKENDNPTA